MSDPYVKYYGTSDEWGTIPFDGRVVTLPAGAEVAVENRKVAIQRAERRRKLRIAPIVTDIVMRSKVLEAAVTALVPIPEVEFCPHCGQVIADDDN